MGSMLTFGAGAGGSGVTDTTGTSGQMKIFGVGGGGGGSSGVVLPPTPIGGSGGGSGLGGLLSGAGPLPPLPIGVTNPPPSPVGVKLSSTNDPTIAAATKEMLAREQGDLGAGRAIDLAGEKIREAGIGAGKELDANLARRGISGTGVEGLLRERQAAGTQAKIAGSASDIANAAEARRDALLNSIVGAGTAQENVRRGEENTQLQAAEIDAQNQRAYEAAQAGQQSALIGLLTALA